jgi:hypothetical protein
MRNNTLLERYLPRVEQKRLLATTAPCSSRMEALCMCNEDSCGSMVRFYPCQQSKFDTTAHRWCQPTTLHANMVRDKHVPHQTLALLHPSAMQTAGSILTPLHHRTFHRACLSHSASPFPSAAGPGARRGETANKIGSRPR